jgi:DNA invertase Pin-like site-specific DNA recombinase
MTRYGYARCSTAEQNLDVQIDILNRHACEMIRQEKVSGTSLEGRHELELLLEFMRPGDELFVCRIDRLARSVSDLCAIAKRLDEKGCRLVITEQQMDTGSSYGRFMLHILGSVAEFENALRRDRQMAGIAKARESDAYKVHKRGPTYDREEIAALLETGMPITRIAKKMGCAEFTIRRARKEIQAASEVSNG